MHTDGPCMHVTLHVYRGGATVGVAGGRGGEGGHTHCPLHAALVCWLCVLYNFYFAFFRLFKLRGWGGFLCDIIM